MKGKNYFEPNYIITKDEKKMGVLVLGGILSNNNKTINIGI